MVQLSVTSHLLLVPYGPPAVAALRDVIAEAKAGDPLTPVTVAVPSNYAGLSLRRTLASSAGGLVNVRFLVLARIAELLGAPLLAQRGLRPLTGSLRAEVVRVALDADPGIFREAAGHTATERSLDSTFRDLRPAPPEALDALARRSDRAAHVVQLFRAFQERTAAYYDEDDLVVAAAEAAGLPAGQSGAGSAALRDVGHVVLYLPRRLTPAARRLLDALAARRSLSAIIGLTGDGAADALAYQIAIQLEPSLGGATQAAPSEAPVGTHIVATTDAEEEVRAVLRLVMERLAQDTPLHRIAVLYPMTEPYALLAHEQFEAAAMPHNGPAVRTLAQTLAGRTLLALLRLRERDVRRDAVMDWLSAAPVLEQPRGAPAPAHRWDALSRAAGVTGGAAQWSARLTRFRQSLAARREALAAPHGDDDADVWRRRRIEADLDHTERLAAFIEELITHADPGRRSTWREFATWGRELLERYLGGEGHRRDWPDREIEAHRAVVEALDALSTLSDVRARCDEATFRRALERELEAPAGRIGRFGEGVFIGRIGDALGTDFGVVYVIGMSEGILPPRGREDPLLPDDERAAAEHVPLRASRLAEERRDYLAALTCAPERVLVFPRADLRGQRSKLPARWLLETASRLDSRAVFSTDFEHLRRPWYTALPSFEGALRDGIEPASTQERDLRSILLWKRAGRPLLDHYLVTETPPLSQGLSAQFARHDASLTGWDGHVDTRPELRPSEDRPISPTALQHWAACPFRYFLGHVLYVAETEHPEDALSITPLERGNLIHRALETFLREAPPRASPAQPWTDGERALLRRTGEEICDEFEAAGRTGRRLLWRLERAQLLRDLDGFLDADQELRAKYGVVTVAVELVFGRDDQPPVLVTLDDGRAVAFRGRIDRVDRAPDGSRLLVLDYKTGSPEMYKRLNEQEPVLGGKLLQLPIYALAAQAEYGPCTTGAFYWFVREQSDYKREGYPVTETQLARFRETLAVIVDGIERGLFPARPGKPSRDGSFENCQICPYNRICPVDRARVWERKANSPGLREYVRLAEGQS